MREYDDLVYNKINRFGGIIMGMGGNVLENDKRKIADFINDYVKKNGYNVVLSNKELNALYEENGVAPESVYYLNSDYCKENSICFFINIS